MAVKIVETKNFKYGVVDTIEAESIPRGAASRSLNWLTKGDHIELRRGQRYMGTASVQSGNGRATGLKKASNPLGVEVLFGTYGQKLKYYDEATTEWIESGSNRLGPAVVDANGMGFEQIFMSEYVSPAGNQLFLNSPNCAGYYKIMTGNPGSALNVYSSAKNFKGFIKIDTNRTLLWGRTKDRTGLYGSYVDSQTFTTVSAEAVGSGDGVTLVYSHTLAAISGTRTVFGLLVTIGGTTFTDNYDGTLTGSDGSAGTINYITGQLQLTFLAAPSGPITVDYQWEDSNAGGISDFTKSSPRTAGQGFIFRQDEGGGPLQSVATYDAVYFCLHLKKTWVLSIGNDDTTATNLPYREKVGIPNERASVETGQGIYYIDDTDSNEVRARLLTYDRTGSTKIIPISVSNSITLNDYRFGQAASIEWGDYILFACATADSTQQLNGQVVPLNNRVLAYNKIWKSWDVLDYAATCFEVYNGALVAGDALSNNFLEFFSGFDDDGADSIPNYWEGRLDDLDVEGLIKNKGLLLRGLVGPDQKLKVSVAVDDGEFVEVGGEDDGSTHTYAIEGSGDYINTGNSVDIGAVVLGRGEVGGGGLGTYAYVYERLIPLKLDKFERIKIRYEAVAVGFVSVSVQTWWDVRFKGRRVPRKYRG